MKIALFSDIHANLPAMEAFLADMDARKPDAVYCLGDLVGYNVWPNEVIAAVRDRGIATIAGNHDLKVSNLKTVDDLELSGKNYAYHIVNSDNREYLSTLSTHIRLTFHTNGGQLNLVLVHGSPRSVDEYLLEELDEGYVVELMAEAEADILCMGHTHIPYHRIIERAHGTFGHVVNIGSVGKPKDNNPMGCYVMLTITEGSSVNDKNSVGVEFIRFAYDVEKAAKAVEDSPLPDEFADRLRKAY